MSYLNETDAVKRQYAGAENLTTRISLYDKYSVRSNVYQPWLFEQYALHPNESVLELGCGTGAVWRGRIGSIPPGCRLTLTDLSEGMVRAVSDAYGAAGIACGLADIQSIPYDTQSFDVVIANSMLYHVPNIPLALQEVTRVLKPGGRFYAATFSIERGIHAYMRAALHAYWPELHVFDPSSVSFTLENGASALQPYFKNVERRIYEDTLAVTDVADLMAWLHSNTAMMDMADDTLAGFPAFLEPKKDAHGVLPIPIYMGLFVAQA